MFRNRSNNKSSKNFEISISDNVMYFLLAIFAIIAYRFAISLASYYYSATLFNAYWLDILSCLTLAYPIFFIVVILLQIAKKKFSIWCRILGPALTIFCVALSFLIIPPDYVMATKGLYTAFNDRPDDVIAIKKWLENYDFNSYDKTIEINESSWPEVIKKIAPRKVYIVKDTVFFVRLIWGSGMLWQSGIVIGIDAERIPLNISYPSEYRIPVDKDSFVWHQLKRKAN